MLITNIIIAGCSFIATIISISVILGKKFDKIEKRFDKIEDELKEIRKEIIALDRRIQKIEDRLEFSNKVVYVQHEEIKEN